MKKLMLIIVLTFVGSFAQAGPIQQIENCYGDASCVGKVLVRVIRNATSSGGNNSTYRCKLEWRSTDGYIMPTLYGIGNSPRSAIEDLGEKCSGQRGNGNAATCKAIYLGATCKSIN